MGDVSGMPCIVRPVLHLTAHERVTGPVVVAAFRAACAAYGAPASTLTDIQDG